MTTNAEVAREEKLNKWLIREKLMYHCAMEWGVFSFPPSILDQGENVINAYSKQLSKNGHKCHFTGIKDEQWIGFWCGQNTCVLTTDFMPVTEKCYACVTIGGHTECHHLYYATSFWQTMMLLFSGSSKIVVTD